MNAKSSATALAEPGPAWYCVRSQPKHEHIAAACLRQDAGIEVFLPRIRFRRVTRQGAAWVTEALFPNYLFARFDWHQSLRQVHHMRGVSQVVHFGERWPTLPDAAIVELRLNLGDDQVHIVPAEFAPGDTVEIVGGPFQGLLGVIRQALPARKRVEVLLDFLGRQTSAEISQDAVVRMADPRQSIQVLE